MHAVLFDLDGLLVDSEGFHFRAYQSVLGEYGIELTEQMFKDSWLSGKEYGTPHYLRQAGVIDPAEIAAARAKKGELYCEYARGRLQPLPGAQGLLHALAEMQIPCGVATGGYENEYRFSLEETGLDPYIQIVVGGNEVTYNKPAPDVYLEAARQLAVAPAKCVVFENSDIGLQSGLSAGMRCIVVTSTWTRDQKFPPGTERLGSLEQVDLTRLFDPA